jgi:hypothetical protein
MEINPAKIWSIFIGADSFENFTKNILQPFFIKDEIIDEIKEDLIIVEKLLQHSYFEYEFIDIAVTQVIFILEKVLRIRYKELTGKSSKRLSFQNLQQWFFENNYFESSTDFGQEQLRFIRNTKVHDEKKILGGQLLIKKFYQAIDCINEVYEDVSLREDRKIATLDYNTQLQLVIKDGGILTQDEVRLLIFGASINFVHNNQPSSTIHLCAWKIFEPQLYSKSYSPQIPYVEFTLSNWKFTNMKLIGKDLVSNKSVTIEAVDVKNEATITSWKSKASKLECWHNILFEMNQQIYDCQILQLRNFHQSIK